MDGRVCMVTGANSGIGLATAQRLAGLGATVVIVCRNKDRGERAAEDIKLRGKSDSVELMLADLASLGSVRSLVEEYAKRHDELHVLINNAGVANVRRRVTTEGFETTFQVNYLSPFLLTNLLLGLLKKSAPSRIVNVSSTAHFGGRIDFDDLQMKKGYRVMKAYSQSKLALVLFTFELARRLRGTRVTANCLHPGAVATNLFGRALGPAAFLGKVSRLFLIGPNKGAETSLYLAASSEVVDVTGKYFDQMREKKASADSYDEALAVKLWDTTASLVGLSSD
jgi:NAD(P)-dependent dehydrogenase (short-subunit alcohol dehydrogenase family)